MVPNNQPLQKKGSAISRGTRWYFNTLLSGIKGAVGLEAFKLSKQMWGNAMAAAKARPCPRCREVSLFEAGADSWACQYPPCQLSGPTDLISRAAAPQMPALILAIAKGIPPKDVERRIRGCQMASRAAWVVATGFLIYAISWLWEGRLLFFVWTGLLAFAVALQGFRFAFQIWQIRHRRRGGLSSFIRQPGAWFV